MTQSKNTNHSDHFITTKPNPDTPPAARCVWRIFIKPDGQPAPKTLRPWLMPRPLPARRM